MMEIKSVDALKQFSGLVLFSAAWCAPCRTYKPLLEQVAKEHGMQLALVDVEAFRQLAGEFTIRAVPTTLRMSHGKELARKQGAQTKQGLHALLIAGEH
jgi:thioredoxin 1